jgi:hypothetical protein
MRGFITYTCCLVDIWFKLKVEEKGEGAENVESKGEGAFFGDMTGRHGTCTFEQSGKNRECVHDGEWLRIKKEKKRKEKKK